MGTVISLLVSLSFTIGVAILLAKRIEKRTRPRKLIGELRSEINSVIAELNNTTDRNLQLIEDRIAQVKEVLDTADKRIKLMRGEVEKTDRGNDVYLQLRKARRGAPVGAAGGDGSVATSRQAGERNSSPADGKQEAKATPVERASKEPGEPAVVPRATNGGGPAPTDTPAVASGANNEGTAGTDTGSDPGETMAPRQKLRARVWEMYAMGENLETIATRVGRTIGEVELMVSLLRKDEV